MRVFLDTNVLVAAFATRGLCSDLLKLVLAEHRLVLTEVVMRELGRVLTGKIGLTAERAEEVLHFLSGFVVQVGVPAPLPITLRDPDDVPVVLSALGAGAELLITGDNDLLEADLPLPALSPRAFWSLLRSKSQPGEEVHEP